MSASPWLQVGYVSRAHGLKGSLVIKTFDPASTALGEVDRVQLTPKDQAPRVVEVEGLREGPGGDLLLEVKGVNGRNEADALVGSAIAVHRDEIEAPDEGSFFQGDLVGLAAQAPDGRPLGKIVEVWSSGPVPNLVLDNGEMVPFADDFVVKVDLPGGTIVLRPLEYDEA